MRKLAAKRKNPENRAERRDIIAEYADFGAKMPEKMREGFRNDKAGTVIPRTEQLFQAVSMRWNVRVFSLGCFCIDDDCMPNTDLDTALLDFDANLPEMEATLPADKAQFSSYKKVRLSRRES